MERRRKPRKEREETQKKRMKPRVEKKEKPQGNKGRNPGVRSSKPRQTLFSKLGFVSVFLTKSLSQRNPTFSVPRHRDTYSLNPAGDKTFIHPVSNLFYPLPPSLIPIHLSSPPPSFPVPTVIQYYTYIT